MATFLGIKEGRCVGVGLGGVAGVALGWEEWPGEAGWVDGRGGGGVADGGGFGRECGAAGWWANSFVLMAHSPKPVIPAKAGISPWDLDSGFRRNDDTSLQFSNAMLLNYRVRGSRVGGNDGALLAAARERQVLPKIGMRLSGLGGGRCRSGVRLL